MILAILAILAEISTKMLIFVIFEEKCGDIGKALRNFVLLGLGAGSESTSEAFFEYPRVLTTNVEDHQKMSPKKGDF